MASAQIGQAACSHIPSKGTRLPRVRDTCARKPNRDPHERPIKAAVNNQCLHVLKSHEDQWMLAQELRNLELPLSLSIHFKFDVLRALSLTIVVEATCMCQQ